ncbi:MAG: hypothetical protein ABI789_09460 [Usitatibacter sp.]
MKRNYISIRAAVAAIGALCGAIMLPSISHAAGSVKVNGVQQCSSSTTMSLDPSGDLVISCLAPGNGGGGGTSGPPSCYVNMSTLAAVVGQPVTIAAVCNPSATGYTWASNGGPAISGQSATVSFPAVGTYSYTVAGTNSSGAGGVSPAVAVLVSATAPVGTGSCANAKPVTGTFTGNGIRNLSIDRGSSVAYALPIYPAAGRTLEMLSVQSTSSQSDLTSEFSVSTCPGDFDTMQPECKTWGTVNQSGTALFGTTSGAVVPGTCTVVVGAQYYVNVRNVKYDRTTAACTPQTCYMILQLNSY